MRLFLLIVLIFFSFALKAQQSTFKVKKENDTTLTIPNTNVSLHFPDSEGDSSIYLNWNNKIVLRCEDKERTFHLMSNLDLKRESDSSYIGKIIQFNKIEEFGIYEIIKGDTIFVKIDTAYMMPLSYETTYILNHTYWNPEISLEELKEVERLEVRIPGMTLKYFKVESFRMMLSNSDKIYIAESEYLFKEMKKALNKLKVGDKIIISHIEYSRNGKLSKTQMPILELTVR